MSDKLGYVVLEVGGIQKYILSNGKLKEMIGGSELIESLSDSYLDDFATENGIKILKEVRKPIDDEVLALQRNAGALHLMFANKEKGKNFLKTFGLRIIADFPGLPIFGALAECEFNSLGIRDAKFVLSQKITEQRNNYPTSTGLQLLPICAQAPLDGEPAVEMVRYGNDSNRNEVISLASRTRRIEKLLKSSRNRLRDIEPDGDLESNLNWTDDLEDISDALGKVAFIHIDGNDLGKRFRKELDKVSNLEEIENAKSASGEKEIDQAKRDKNTIRVINKMATLSKTVKDATTSAFKKGLTACLKYADFSDRKIVPARPLVLGGDDVTLIIRPDLALYFIDAFVKEFERYSNQAFLEQNKNNKNADQHDKLTVGVGMVVCPTGYPFLKAFDLSEELLKNAKEVTAGCEKDRPSSMDYIVITNDTENSLDSIRSHLFTAEDGAILTAKPLILKGNNLAEFVKEGIEVSEKLPRSAVRNALNECRKGVSHANNCYQKLKDNVLRGLGGRANKKLMEPNNFTKLFPEESGFFFQEKGVFKTKLGDYIELNHLLSVHLDDYKDYFKLKD
ncbi:MAG: Cas10/Cmr2 second palm domain-containing protein [Succinivibrio sp.]